MKTPWFWRSVNIVSLFLLPFSYLYNLVAKVSFAVQSPKKFSTRIVCVGNIIAGGSGKTPVAIMIGKILLSKGYKIAYACKNYKGKICDAIQVINQQPGQVVEESLLLSKVADTFVAQKLLDAVSMADSKRCYDFILTDDGLQNASFAKDKVILVVDGDLMFLNNFLIPAGPMRESFDSARNKIDCVAVIGKSRLSTMSFQGVPVINLERKHNIVKKVRYFAFTGVAYPEKFYSSLKSLGVDVVGCKSYPDHFIYSDSVMQDLNEIADAHGAKLITTEKDSIKINKIFMQNIEVLRMELEPKIQDKLEEILEL